MDERKTRIKSFTHTHYNHGKLELFSTPKRERSVCKIGACLCKIGVLGLHIYVLMQTDRGFNMPHMPFTQLNIVQFHNKFVWYFFFPEKSQFVHDCKNDVMFYTKFMSMYSTVYTRVYT